MCRKKTTQEFIEKANIIHNYKYNYSLVNYIGTNKNVKIICSEHGEFKQITSSHLKGCGCKKCSNDKQRYSNEKFIEKANIIHNYKYDYSLVNYYKTNQKIKIICPEHGEFKQVANSHLMGCGCKKCSNVSNFLTKKQFIEKAILIHNDKYNYININYINTKTKIKIFCNGCQEYFWQTPNSHLSGKNCNNCNKTKKLNTETFIEKSEIVHNYKYDYSTSFYINSRTKIKIICPIHGEFEQLSSSHIRGCGCKKCNVKSRGEKDIEKFLIKNKINYIKEKSFDNCKYKKLLKFDFYLIDSNICIEFDGKHHFEIHNHFGGNDEFLKIKMRDKIKDEYCKNNNIILIRIKYDDNIKESLKNNLTF
jgi:hypothetical protein